MSSFSKITKKHESKIIIIIFFIFFIISAFIYDDYGLSVDEWDLRVLGYINLNYIYEIFLNKTLNNINDIVSSKELSEYYGTHGVIFSLPTAAIEYILNINDSRSYYLFRHYFNHIVFLISNFYFYLLLKDKYQNAYYGILGSVFLFLSPRIYAESFYNHKDIIFLSLFIINLYYLVKFIKDTNYKNSIYLSLITSLSIDMRIMGVIIVPVIIFVTLVNFYKKENFQVIKSLFLYLISLCIFTILFWPYLWESPLSNFINVFTNLSSYDWEGYNFYMGEFYYAKNMPWHYIFTWISISTPIFYLGLFLYGSFVLFFRLFKRILKINENSSNDFWKSQNEIEDIIYLFLFFTPIFMIILLNSTVYGGWRHLYFIYPCLLIISIKGIYLLDIYLFKNKKLILNTILIVFTINIAYQMIKIHPHQNVYFNVLAGKNVEEKFELDYWGLSNKQAFEFILNNDNSKIIKIGSATTISLENSKKILKENDRNRINISENIEADYIVDNHTYWKGKHKEKQHIIPENFDVYKEIFADKKRIVTIYKKIY